MTIDTLVERASRINWFARVGEPVRGEGALEIVPMRTWKQALDRAGSVSNSNAWMKAQSLLTIEVGLNHRLEYRKWNDHVAEAHEAMRDIVFAQADAVIDSVIDIQKIEDGVPFLKHQVRWDMVAACMEQVYSHIVPSRFYTLLFQNYESGHYPCGWDEVWPSGKLWVY